MLKEAIQKEEKALDIETDEQINSGYQTQETTEAVVDPKYKDIKEIQQYLYEDNIRDTNPILILSFNKLIGLTIDYLQNLRGILKVISANSHEKDSINISVKEAILELFSGNEVNSYELNLHIRTVLGESIDEIFNGLDSMPLTFFCTGLVDQIQLRLINVFKTTSKKELKKDFGKKFRKHKKGPYPSVSKILRAIDLNDVPHNVQGDADKERRIKNLTAWHDNFIHHLSNFKSAHKTDFLNNASLQKELKGFGNSLQEETTPPSCKLHLFDNVVNGLGANDIIKVADLTPVITTELETLRKKIKASIEAGDFKGSDDIDHFVGIKAENYFDYIRTALEKNRFDEYKKIIKDWVIALDQLMNKLGLDEERGKFNYKSKIIALNLSKLFRIEHDLIDFSSFIKKIIEGVKATGFSLELSEVDTLFSDSISEGNIYTKLIGLYNTAVEKGTFDSSLDTLETTLPTMTQIGQAIVRAKIDLILNREVQFLTLAWELEWRNRDNVIQNLLAFLRSQTSIGTTIINTLEGLIRGAGGEIPPSRITLDIPVKLSLAADKNGKAFAFACVDKEASEKDIYSINNQSPYTLNAEGVYNTITSDVTASKDKIINSILNLKLEFENEGVGVGIDISAPFISTGGNAIINQRTLSLILAINLTSSFDGVNTTINISGVPNFNGLELINNNNGELRRQPIYNGVNTSLTFKTFN